jgi:hypothetical protein
VHKAVGLRARCAAAGRNAGRETAGVRD